jgi:hypothetical protein
MIIGVPFIALGIILLEFALIFALDPGSFFGALVYGCLFVYVGLGLFCKKPS